jgi:hypothetical protein
MPARPGSPPALPTWSRLLPRRWPLRARRPDQSEIVVDVRVPESTDGVVLLRVDDAVLALQPEEVSRLRAALLQAQAVALQDRDRW